MREKSANAENSDDETQYPAKKMRWSELLEGNIKSTCILHVQNKINSFLHSYRCGRFENDIFTNKEAKKTKEQQTFKKRQRNSVVRALFNDTNTTLAAHLEAVIDLE